MARDQGLSAHDALTGRIGRAALAAALLASPALAAGAEWHGALGAGAQRVTNTEFDQAGATLVRETGWLPGVVARLGWRCDRLGFFAGAEVYQHGIAYDGRTQSGVAAQSTSATRLTQLRAGVSYALGAGVAGFVGAERDNWRRDIEPAAGAAGLQERSSSTRLLLGARGQWHGAAIGVVGLDGALVAARPERLAVGFSGLLDATTLTTRRARGWRIGASLRPAAAPRMELRAGFDTIVVSRSGDVPLTRAGQFVGTIAQPEHARRALSLTLSALF